MAKGHAGPGHDCGLGLEGSVMTGKQKERPATAATVTDHERCDAGRQSLEVHVRESTRLVNAPADLARKIRDHFTIRNPAHVQALKHDRWTGNLPEWLEYFSQAPDGLTVPRGATASILALAKQAGIVPVIHDDRLVLGPVNFAFQGQLRPYQARALKMIMGREQGVLEAGTGSGKTTTALAAIAERGQPALVIVHNKELLRQWQDRARQFLGVETGLVGDGKFEIRPLTIGIVNSVRNRLADLTGHFGHLVIDECHRAPSATFQECAAAFPAKYRLGLSATPFRRDGLDKLIFWSMGETVCRIDPKELVDCGAILRPEIVQRQTSFEYQYRDDYAKMISALCENRQRNLMITADVIRNLNGSGTSLVVTDRISHCETLADMLRGHNVVPVILTGQTKKAKRQAIVDDVQAGKVRVLISTLALISEGFDCSGLDQLYLASPVKFRGRIMQTVGRILRPAQDKKAVVYDYQDILVPVLRAQAKQRWMGW